MNFRFLSAFLVRLLFSIYLGFYIQYCYKREKCKETTRTNSLYCTILWNSVPHTEYTARTCFTLVVTINTYTRTHIYALYCTFLSETLILIPTSPSFEISQIMYCLTLCCNMLKRTFFLKILQFFNIWKNQYNIDKSLLKICIKFLKCVCVITFNC